MAPSVAEFYANKSVVVTGSTGFLGKTLVEKLLRDCPQLHKIYVLVRPAKDKTPAQRVEEVVQGVLFDRLRRKDADFAHKIHPVLADLAKPGMGIAEEDLVEMRRNASIILHCAATVNFNEKLDLSLATNVSSVKNLIAFARTLERLEAFVHVSTAYAHCDRSHIEEKFYEPTVKPQALIDAVNSMSPEAMAGVTKPLLGKRPNTYTFTKSLAEAVLLAEGGDLPAAVVRPSIVGGVFREPFPGWTDNLNGPGGFYLAAAHGLLRVMAGTPTGIVDIVPVDHCVNMIVAVGWKLGTNRPAAPMVFNCTSGATNPIKLKAHNDYVLDAIEASPIKAGLLGSRPFVPLASEWQYYNLWNPVMHTAPAMAIDLYRRVVGKKPIMNRIYQKLNNSIRAYAFFTTYEWHWDVNNSAALVKEMSEQDRKLFPLDLTELNWELYIKNYYEGCKRFLKEDQPAKSNMASAPSSDSLTPASLTSSPSAVNMSARVTLAQKSVPCAFLTSTLVALLAAMFMVFFYDLIFNSSTSSTHAANPENRTADDEHYATTFSYASAPFPFNLLGHILASE